MALELRIISGARAGQVLHFDKPQVTIGRHAAADVRFDAQKDLDVSGRHAEVRFTDQRYWLHDAGSTNGTFVNGERISGPRPLSSGDRVMFGAKGPEVEVRLHRGARNTEERIAIAVKKETAGLQRILAAGAGVLALGLAAAFLIGQRFSGERDEELRRLLTRNDSLSAVMQSGMSGTDTALVNALQRRNQGLRAALASAGTDAERDSLRRAIEGNDRQLRRMAQMDLPSIYRRNAPAVAVLVAELGGRSYAGTGFAISSDGVLLTNRHNVRAANGELASRIAVKFVDTREWRPASVLKVSDEPDDDLALIKLDDPGPYPTVAGVSADADATEGVSVVTIGFPLGYDTPQEGAGNDFMAKSTLNPGTVSKRTSTVLQIDSYAAHGSSGSPVFNTQGHVVGVVYGGAAEAGGRIVFAVPPDRVAAFIPPALRAIVKD